MILNKNPFTPTPPSLSPSSSPFLIDNFRLHGILNTSFEKALMWKVSKFFYFLFYISILYQQISFSLSVISTKCDKSFLSNFSEKSSMMFFFSKHFLTKYCKAFFLKVSTKDSFIFFSKHNPTAAILTQASVITCK